MAHGGALRHPSRMPAGRLAALLLVLNAAMPALAQARLEPAASTLGASGRPGTAPASTTATSDARPRLVPMEVVLNGANVGNWLLLQTPEGFHAPREALDAWRLVPRPDGGRFAFQQENWYALSSIDGHEVRFDPATQSIDLRFAPSAFLPTRLGEEPPDLPPVTEAVPAAFLNYDVSWNHYRANDIASSSEIGALTELGFTSRWGVFTSSFIGRHAQGRLAGGSGSSSSQWRRLETIFTRDFPERQFSVRVGDTTTRAALIGRQVYYGGVQIARNFDLMPSFVSQPLPVFTGTSSVPSTVELYINDALRQTLNVPAGPFTIDNPMPVSGDGRARMVVRDVLGRETVITQSFFSHAELLEEDLTDWGIDLGAVRNNLGLANADYGERFTSGLWRRGLNKRLTMEARGEWGQQTRGLGVGFSRAMPWQGLGQASLAWSRNATAGTGLQWTLGTEYNPARQSYTLQAQGASVGYRALGQGDTAAPRWQLSGSFSQMFDRLGIVGLGMALLQPHGAGRLSTYSLSHSMRLGARGSLNTVLTRISGSSSGTFVGVSLSWPLDRQINTSAYVSHRSGQTTAHVSASQGLRGSTGVGWRALAGSRNGTATGEAGLYVQGHHSLLTADVSASSAQQSVRLGSQGGLVFIGGRLFASRPVQEGFALVSVPGLSGVGVNFQGRDRGRTDEQGAVLVTGLQAYNVNNVRLNPTDLPLSAEIDNLEQVVVPPRRSAVRVGFKVRSGQVAVVTVKLPDGKPAPTGAEIELVGDVQRFMVGRGGQAFITGLKPQQLLRLHWNRTNCLMSLTLAPGAPDDIARPPPLVCEGVSP